MKKTRIEKIVDKIIGPRDYWDGCDYFFAYYDLEEAVDYLSETGDFEKLFDILDTYGFSDPEYCVNQIIKELNKQEIIYEFE